VSDVCTQLMAHGAAAGPQQLGHGAVLGVPAAPQRSIAHRAQITAMAHDSRLVQCIRQ
jgi:hypothetical protein